MSRNCSNPVSCCGCPGPVGPPGPRGVQGIKGDTGPAGGGTAGGRGGIVNTFAIDSPALVDTPNLPAGFIPADGTEYTLFDLPFTVAAGATTIDAFGYYSFTNGGTTPVDARFFLRIDPATANNVVASSHEGAPNATGGFTGGSGAMHRRLTGLSPGNHVMRMTVIAGAGGGLLLMTGGPAVPENDYGSIYIQTIAT